MTLGETPWRERYLALYQRLKLTCPSCGWVGAHEMGCANSGLGIDGFDIEVTQPLSPHKGAGLGRAGDDSS